MKSPRVLIDEDGAAAIEYALLGGVLAVAILVSFSLTGAELASRYMVACSLALQAMTGASCSAAAFAGTLAAVLLWAVRGALLLLLIAICRSDWRTRRIPNRLVLIGLAAGLAWQALAPAGSGLFDRDHPGALGAGMALAGAAVAFAGFFMLHLARMMGAGDVKLMTMLGAFFGMKTLPLLVVMVFLAGGVLVAARMLDGGRRRALAANLRLMAFGRLAAFSGSVGPQFDPRTDTADRLPFAFAIAGGALLVAALQLSGTIA